MVRPTFIIAEPAPGEGLSSRKLVIETAYFNVLTAYSGPELLEMIPKFPNSEAVIVHTGVPKLDIYAVERLVREKMPNSKLVALSQTSSFVSNDLDAVLSSHDPQQLLEYLEEEFGQQKDTRQVS